MTVYINGVAEVGVTKLSELEIDVSKDWGAKKIENIGTPDTADDAMKNDPSLMSDTWKQYIMVYGI